MQVCVKTCDFTSSAQQTGAATSGPCRTLWRAVQHPKISSAFLCSGGRSASTSWRWPIEPAGSARAGRRASPGMATIVTLVELVLSAGVLINNWAISEGVLGVWRRLDPGFESIERWVSQPGYLRASRCKVLR